MAHTVHTYLVGWFRWMDGCAMYIYVMCPKRFPETFSYIHSRILLREDTTQVRKVGCLEKWKWNL